MERALELAEALEPELRDYTLMMLAVSLSESSPLDALAFISEDLAAHRRAQSDAVSQVFRTLVAKDLTLAASLVEHVPVGNLREKAIDIVASQWDEDSGYREGALWASKLGFADMQNLALDKIAQNAARSQSLSEVESLIKDLEIPHFRRVLIQFKARQMVRDDPQKALAWLESFSPGGRVEASVIQAWATLKPREAADHVAALEDLDKARDLYKVVAGKFVGSNPEAASEWTIQMSTKFADFDTLRGTLTSWLHHDSLAASRWIAELPRGIARDHAISAMVGYLHAESSSPEEVSAWIQEIEEPTLRTNWESRTATDDEDAAMPR